MDKQPAVYDVEFSLAEAYSSVAEARRYVRATLAIWPFAGCHDDVELVVSELVGNALRHGRGRPVLRLSGMRDWLRIEVVDDSEVMPRSRRSGADGGWGLHLIERLSTAWGVDPRPHGKVVWCELPGVPAVAPAVVQPVTGAAA
ncbi:Histidine kinase-like ATPase domain-containing protein [Micromonospora pattaloongensis]|uniref:Histidine kinase-like ATPase domain-containing protein n=1 Tax=Micromonospora pattaloongensis TaxID=405436 RepID=A0A1H3NQG9_9ACTN|nr:ATP-binding protein [Micromonospora pattaloongensis]SDY91048.1 Histidine kinase-like ATPase domain-containing protein [Micromonospora pattaloongensis]